MGRKRNAVVRAGDEKENVDATAEASGRISADALQSAMHTIMCNVQNNRDYHSKYTKEICRLYEKVDHNAFVFNLIKNIKAAMGAEEVNEFAANTLIFCANYIGSLNQDITHPVLAYVCNWLLSTTSHNPHIRFRLCQFINMILSALGQEAALDDTICDRITESMLERLRDTSPNVRVQAVLALQRLQTPDNPDDPVIRAYTFHMSSDPSGRVRMQVISCIGRNYQTIPQVMERLWDIDEKVRRHTYIHMSNFTVRSLKVAQRLIFLEQGLNDRSESVRKVVTNVMLRNWIEAYQKNVIDLIGAMKLDASEADMSRFKKVTQLMLAAIFKQQDTNDLIAQLPLELEGEFYRCVPQDKLTIEVALYWQCLVEHFISIDADEYDSIVPELSGFCKYVASFCQKSKSDMDKFDRMIFQFTVLSLIEILCTYDLGDEIGRRNLQKLLTHLLKDYIFDEKIIEVIVKCTKNLIADQHEFLEYFKDVLQDITVDNAQQNDLLHDRALTTKLMYCSNNPQLNVKISSLKVRILDLEEQEMNAVRTKNYVKAQAITDEKSIVTEEYTNLLKPLLEKYALSNADSMPLLPTSVMNTESILHSLQIAFYVLISTNWKRIDPLLGKVYNDFICRHLAANHIGVRDLALKCSTAYSMTYKTSALEVFKELHSQFSNSSSIRLWETAVSCIFELLDKYGVGHFSVVEDRNKSKRANGRQLYNSQFSDMITLDDDSQNACAAAGTEVLNMMGHIMTTCDEIGIKRAIVIGFCRLVLHGHVKNKDIIEKIFLLYFNPTTEAELHQALSVFMNEIVARRLYYILETGLVPTVMAVLCATSDSPLYELRADTITHFFIDATRMQAKTGCGNIHNKIAVIFLQEMLANVNNKELCKLLSKEILTLEVDVNESDAFRNNLKKKADELLQNAIEPKTSNNLNQFRMMLDGVFIPQITTTDGMESDDETNLHSEIHTSNAIDSDTQSEVRKTPARSGAPNDFPQNSETAVQKTVSVRKQLYGSGNNMAIAVGETSASSGEDDNGYGICLSKTGKEVLSNSNEVQSVQQSQKGPQTRAFGRSIPNKNKTQLTRSNTKRKSNRSLRFEKYRGSETLNDIAEGDEQVEEDEESSAESTLKGKPASASNRNGQDEQSTGGSTLVDEQAPDESFSINEQTDTTNSNVNKVNDTETETSTSDKENDDLQSNELDTSDSVLPSPNRESFSQEPTRNGLHTTRSVQLQNSCPQSQARATNVSKMLL